MLSWLLSGALGLSLVAAACGNDDAATDPSGSENPSDSQVATNAPSVPSGDVDPNGVIRTTTDLAGSAVGGFWWDPVKNPTAIGTANPLYYLVYGTLLRPTGDGEVVPDLAESTEVVNPRTIVVTLREGLTFADGDPFDAAAVKAGLERNLAAEGSPGFGTGFFDLESVEVIDQLTVRLTIPNGTAASWHDTFLASWETAIVPADTDFNAPSGAGPMKVTAYTPEVSATLTKSERYWDADSIKVAAIELLSITNLQAGLNALKAGQVDITGIELTQADALTDGQPLIFQPDTSALTNMQVCKREGPLADPKVRLALNKAIDRDVLNEAVFDGRYSPAYGLWPDGHRYHDPANDDTLSYDPAEAKRLLEEAGYPDGFEFDLYVIPVAGMTEIGQIIEQQYAEVGITANLIPSANYVEDFHVPQKPGAGLVPTMSPDRLKLLQWTGASSGNTCGYDDPELNALQQQLNRVSNSSDEAVDLWHEIERKVVNDALSVFVLFGGYPVAYDASRIANPVLLPYVGVIPDPRHTYITSN